MYCKCKELFWFVHHKEMKKCVNSFSNTKNRAIFAPQITRNVLLTDTFL